MKIWQQVVIAVSVFLVLFSTLVAYQWVTGYYQVAGPKTGDSLFINNIFTNSTASNVAFVNVTATALVNHKMTIGYVAVWDTSDKYVFEYKENGNFDGVFNPTIADGQSVVFRLNCNSTLSGTYNFKVSSTDGTFCQAKLTVTENSINIPING
jgi:hypothetical protein